MLSLCREGCRTGSSPHPMSFCGFGCAFLPFPTSSPRPSPAAETPEHKRGGRTGSGSTTALRVTVQIQPQHVRGKLLTPSYSHGPWAPAFLLSRAPPVRDTGTCTGEVAAGWPEQRAEVSTQCAIGGGGGARSTFPCTSGSTE